MFIFYLLTILAALPIIAYVLAQKTINKGLIFGSSLLILSLCLFMFISKFAFVGSFEKQALNNKIFDEIYINSAISVEYLQQLENILDEDELKNWLVGLIGKSIDLKKLTSAESLIAFSERFFISNNEKLIFYNLYSALRDEKFPKFKNSSFQIDSSSLYPCSIKNGEVTLFITNGPEIPIAKKEFKNEGNISLNNLDSVIPGFDLASAYLNQESIEMKIKINCLDDQQTFFVQNIIVLNKDIPSNSYKINLNEWFKNPQEL